MNSPSLRLVSDPPPMTRREAYAAAPGASDALVDSALASVAPSSRRTLRRRLDACAHWLPPSTGWVALTSDTASRIRGSLADQVAAGSIAPATAAGSLAAVRGVARELWRSGAIDADERDRILDALRAIGGSRLTPGRHVGSHELRRVFAALRADDSVAARRDAAMISILYGARRAEALGIDVADVDLRAAAVALRKAKGAKERIHPLAGDALRAVREWLRVRGDAPGPLLCAVDRWGTVRTDRRLSMAGAAKALKRRASQAGVGEFSAHDLRRTAIGDLLDAGTDLATVSALVGHADPRTTAGYDRRPAAQRAAAMSKVARWSDDDAAD